MTSWPRETPKAQDLFCSLDRSAPGMMSQLPLEAPSCPSFCPPCVSSQRWLTKQTSVTVIITHTSNTHLCVHPHTRASAHHALAVHSSFREHVYSDPGSSLSLGQRHSMATTTIVVEETKSPRVGMMCPWRPDSCIFHKSNDLMPLPPTLFPWTSPHPPDHSWRSLRRSLPVFSTSLSAKVFTQIL